MTWFPVPSHAPGDLVTAADWNAMAQDLAVRTQPTVFTSSGTFPDPGTGISRLRIRVVGGGGAGGGAETTGSPEASCGGGGGSGGYSESTLLVTAITFPVTVTVGAAGAAVTGGTGGTGGTSSFGIYVIANGGTGGVSIPTDQTTVWATPGDGAPTTGAVGQIVSGGNAGQFGLRILQQARGGGGGAGPFGGAPRAANSANPGLNTRGYGAGGAGASLGDSQPQSAGSAGHTGLVVIELLY